MVDRGADLSWLSQCGCRCPSCTSARPAAHATLPHEHRYPHEREVLLPPLTGVEAFGTEVEGGTLVVHARLSLNLNGGTLEQVLLPASLWLLLPLPTTCFAPSSTHTPHHHHQRRHARAGAVAAAQDADGHDRGLRARGARRARDGRRRRGRAAHAAEQGRHAAGDRRRRAQVRAAARSARARQHHGQSGRLGGAVSGHHALLRPHPEAQGCPPHP